MKLSGRFAHYSSDSTDTTARKCLIQLLWELNVGRRVLCGGINVNFAGMKIFKPGAYGKIVSL